MVSRLIHILLVLKRAERKRDTRMHDAVAPFRSRMYVTASSAYYLQNLCLLLAHNEVDLASTFIYGVPKVVVSEQLIVCPNSGPCSLLPPRWVYVFVSHFLMHVPADRVGITILLRRRKTLSRFFW